MLEVLPAQKSLMEASSVSFLCLGEYYTITLSIDIATYQ